MSTNVRTLTFTNGGAIALHSVLRDVKWYTELTDLMNAGALSKLLLKKVPALADPNKIPVAEQEAWVDKTVTLKLNQAIIKTAVTCLEAHAKQGAFMATPHIMTLFQQFGIEFTDHTDDLLALNADEPATAEAVAG